MILPDSIINQIIRTLEESVKSNPGDGLLLSGGLDTTIIAFLSSKWNKPGCVTVALRDAPAPDIEYAKLVANKLGLKHYVHYFDQTELEESIQDTIRVTKSYDPMEIRNSAAVHLALKTCRGLGMATIMTGDGADELLAGYSFYFQLSPEQIEAELRELWSNMRFSSIDLGKDLGLTVRLPFLDPQFKSVAMNLDASLKVRSETGLVWGKWILRKAFENIIPRELLWRVKAPVEVGTGTTTLPSYFDTRIGDGEFGLKKQKYLSKDRITIRSKEHLFYYEIFRRIIGVPHPEDINVKTCPECNTNVAEKATFCRTCGAYPI